MSQMIDFDVVRERAKVLARNDREMRRELIRLRREAGLTQAALAEMMGCTQQAIQKFERYDADPKLSTLRRYANAIGALVDHDVRADRGESQWRAHEPYRERSASTRTTVRAGATSVVAQAGIQWMSANTTRSQLVLAG